LLGVGRKHFTPRPEPAVGSSGHLSLVLKVRFISGAMPLLLLAALMEWTGQITNAKVIQSNTSFYYCYNTYIPSRQHVSATRSHHQASI
jgi:hypothetical protein